MLRVWNYSIENKAKEKSRWFSEAQKANKEYSGFYVDVLRTGESFSYSWINNSFFLIGEIDFKDKYGSGRSTCGFDKVYIQTIKLLQTGHDCGGSFNPTLPSEQQGRMYKQDGLKHLKCH